MGFGKSAHPRSCACPEIYVWFCGWDYRLLFLLCRCRLPKRRISEWVFLQRITQNYRNYFFTAMKNRSRTRQNGCSLWSSLRDHDTNKLRLRTARWAWGLSLAPSSGSLLDSVSDSVTESSAMLFTAWTCAFWSTVGAAQVGLGLGSLSGSVSDSVAKSLAMFASCTSGAGGSVFTISFGRAFWSTLRVAGSVTERSAYIYTKKNKCSCAKFIGPKCSDTSSNGVVSSRHLGFMVLDRFKLRTCSKHMSREHLNR